MGKRNITPDTTVYIASAWWQDSDPSMSVVATTDKIAEADIRRQMKDAAKDARDDGSYRTISDALDDIAWSGVFPEPLKNVVLPREMDQAIAELEEDSIFYPELP